MGDVIKFPLRNTRTELGVLELNQPSVEEHLESMKLGKFAAIADAIIDDVYRSIAILKIEESVEVPAEPTPKDAIMLKEAIIASMARIVGIRHPLHDIEDQELIFSEYIEDVEGFDVPYYHYRFKSEPEDKTRSEV